MQKALTTTAVIDAAQKIERLKSDVSKRQNALEALNKHDEQSLVQRIKEARYSTAYNSTRCTRLFNSLYK